MKREYNLKKLKKRKASINVDKNAIKIPMSLRIDATTLVDIKTLAEQQKIPYQTLIGSILHRYTQGDLIDKQSTKRILKIVKG